MCFSAAFVNFAGLPLDIFGVILLFRYGLPPDVHLSQEGVYIRWPGGDTPWL